MKRKTSKEILAESFREVAERKNIDKITVKDITENCGYSPATFYRQFRDKYDLIAWDYTRELKNILSKMDGSKAEWQKALSVPSAMMGCIQMPKEELLLLRELLNKALRSMETR